MPSHNQNLHRIAPLVPSSSLPADGTPNLHTANRPSPGPIPANGIPRRRVRPRVSNALTTQNATFARLRDSFTTPLSQDTTTDLALFDIEAHVHRPAAARQAEAARPSNRRKTPGRIPRPPNAFLLYRRTYDTRARAFCERLMRSQQGVSYITGVSWHLEEEEVREKFRALAEVERLGHLEAFPGWRYVPVHKVREVVKEEAIEEAVEDVEVAADADADAVMVPQEGVDVWGDYNFNGFNNDLDIDDFDYQYGMYLQWEQGVMVENAFFDDASLMAPVDDASLMAPVEDVVFQAAAYDPLLLADDPLLLADDSLLQAVTAAAEPFSAMSAQVEAPPVVLCSQCACQVVSMSADTTPLAQVADGP